MKTTALLKIPLLNGKVWETEAEIVGDLALHQHRDDTDLLSMTHVPTLLTFRGGVPAAIHGEWKKSRRKPLLAWMKKVQEGMPKDWLALRKIDAKSVRNDPDYSAKLRERVRNHCLNISASGG